MMEKKVTLLILFLIFLIHLKIVFALPFYDPDTELCISDCDYQAGDYSKIDWDRAAQAQVPPKRIHEIPADKVDVTKVQDQSKLTKPQLTFKDSSGTPNINKVSDWNNLDKTARDPALSELTKKSIVTEGITNGKVVGNGIKFDSIKFLKIDQTSINNCIGCTYDGAKLKFGHADSVLTDRSASTSVDNFDGYEDIFSVEKADSFLSGGIRVDEIEDSEFKIDNKTVEITTKSNVNLKITDASYNQAEFKGKGRITIDKNSDSNMENKIYFI